MYGPHKMVVISLFGSFLLLAAILIYKYIYPKKNIHPLVLLTLISILPIMSIFRAGSYESGDFTIHIYRTIEYFNSLKEGHIMPSWAGGLNATYGYPLFIFNYPLPYYLISFFHWIGFSFITSMKLFLATNFILSGIFMYLFSKKLFKNTLAAFATAIFYQFAPYHLIDLHFKVVIGEILTFTLLPLTFFFFQKLWEKKNGLWFSLAAISIALLIMSHVVLALFAMVLIVIYAFFFSQYKSKKQFLTETILPLIVGSICSAYIWLTPFFMMKYTIVKEYTFVYFPQIWELLYSPWRMGFLFQGHKGELSFLLGYTHVFVIIALAALLFSHKISKKIKKQTLFWLIAFLIIIFLITPYSKFIWGLFPFLKITGSHRILLLAAFISSILAGYFALQITKKQTLLYAIICVTIFSTILNWGHRRVIPEIGDQQLLAGVAKSTATGEGHFYANSQYRDQRNPWFKELPKQSMQIIKGTGEIKDLERSSTNHSYIIYAKTPISIKENTLFFPGWKATSNNKSITISPDKEGIISFSLPKGLHYVELKYEDLLTYQIVKAISVAGFVALLIYLSLYLYKRRGF